MPEITRLDVRLKEAAPPAQPAPPPPPPQRPATAPPPAAAPRITPPEEAPAPEATVTPEAPPEPEATPTPAEAISTPAEAPSTPEVVETPAPVEKEEIAATETRAVLPQGGVMRYLVYRGDQGFEVGRAELQWRIDDGLYYLNLHTETSGLAALLHPVAADATSVGEVGPEGLRPNRYTLVRDDKNVEDAEFSWELQTLTIGARDAELLHPGSQDILSLQYQFAYMTAPIDSVVESYPRLEFWVANDKRYELIRFEVQGEEILELPAGAFRTLHLQSVGSDKTIDFWLAEDHQMLPVKTRFTDKHGEIYEQAISELLIENASGPDPEKHSPDLDILPAPSPPVKIPF